MKINKWRVLAVVVLAGCIAWYIFSEKPDGSLAVKTAPVRFGSLDSSAAAVGQVKPREEIVIRARTAGLICEVAPKEGDWVSKDQVVVQLDSPTGAILVRSPIAGKVISRPKTTDPGASVAPGQELLTLANLNDLIVEAEVNEVDAVNVRSGQAVTITTDALPGAVYRGTVNSVAPQVKEVEGVAKVLVKIGLRSASALIPGNKVDVEILTAQQAEVTSVPLEAIFKNDGKKKIFVVEAGKAVAVDVVTGISNLNYIEISSKHALKPGDKVIITSDPDLKDGTKVRIIEQNGGPDTNQAD